MNISISPQAQPKVDVPFYLNSDDKFQAYQDTLRRWSMVGGSLFFLAEIAIHEAYQKLERHKLFKQVVKKNAKKCYEMLNGGGLSIDDFVKEDMLKGYDLWTDITDVAQTYAEQHLMCLKIAVRNYVANHCKKDCEIKAEMLYSVILYGMAVDFFDKFFVANTKRVGYDFTNKMKKYRCTATYNLWENAVKALAHDVEGSITKDQKVIDAHNAFFNVLASDKWFDNVCMIALKNNGNYEELRLKIEENNRIAQENKEREDLGLDRLKDKYNVTKLK